MSAILPGKTAGLANLSAGRDRYDMPATRRGTYALLDAGRGFACLWVVCHHALGFMAEGNPAISRNIIYTLLLNGALGVWIFFVISGYCIANTAVSALNSGKRGWIYARARRIFPPCWYSAVLCAASALLAQYAVHRGLVRSSNLASLDLIHQTPLFYISNLTLTQELFHQRLLSGVYWTLCYEVGFYLLVAVSLGISRKFSMSGSQMLNLLHLVTLATLAADILIPRQVPYPLDLWPHFGFGVLVYDLLSNGWRRVATITSILAACGVIVFAVSHPIRAGYVDRGGYVAMLTSAICAATLLLLYRFDARISRVAGVRVLAWVGVLSYSLYLTHVTLISYVYKVCQMSHLLPRLLPFYLLIALTISIVFAWGFFQICERPFMASRARGRAKTVLHLAR
jgi:exopolysaccharide production protein ExoZ